MQQFEVEDWKEMSTSLLSVLLLVALFLFVGADAKKFVSRAKRQVVVTTAQGGYFRNTAKPQMSNHIFGAYFK